MRELTPLDIQKQMFSSTLRGFSADEVRAFLHLVAEEVESLLKENDRLGQENAFLREESREHADREKILKDTLLTAQRISEEMKENGRKEAELVVRNAEGVAERVIEQAMQRVAELERSIQDLKIERKSMRNKLAATIETFAQLVQLDAEQESLEEPITQMYRKREQSR